MLADLHLQNFRSYGDESFDFSPGVNIIVGPNASGKTNLLEAVLVVAKGKSYRVKDSELISFNKDWAKLESHQTNGSSRVVKITPSLKPIKTYLIDNKPYMRLPNNHTLPVVLFEPNHLRLLSGGPDRRREYLDDTIEQQVVGYSKTRAAYKRALSQRNALLKHPSSSNRQQVFPWNIRLSQIAGEIIRQRTHLTNKLNQNINEVYSDLSKSKTKVSLLYGSKWSPDIYESSLLKDLENNIETDRLKGFTSSGPHREDLQIFFNKHLAQESASRGELRTAILSLKILELNIIEELRGVPPILLLDDVFSELDSKRRDAVTNYLENYQTFITTTDADLVLHHLSENRLVIPLKNNP